MYGKNTVSTLEACFVLLQISCCRTGLIISCRTGVEERGWNQDTIRRKRTRDCGVVMMKLSAVPTGFLLPFTLK